MADTTLTAVPSSIYQGDTLNLLIELSSFPATADWDLTYSFRKSGGTAIDFTGTASGANHSFAVTSATTSTWLPGVYNGVGKVSDGAESFTIWRGTMEILPDLSAQDSNYDTRSFDRKCLDAVLAVMQKRAGISTLQFTIAGQSVGSMTPEQLEGRRAYHQARVDAEQAAIDLANGRGSGNHILVRFGNP